MTMKENQFMDVSYYWRIPSTPNASFFASTGYYGSDPYNIYYPDSYFFGRAGLAFGFFEAPERILQHEIRK